MGCKKIQYMKYLKTFEQNIDEPKVDDYVIIYGDYFDITLINFFSKNIGRIIEINNNKETNYKYLINFEIKIPIFETYSAEFSLDEISEWSYDKEILKIKVDVKKYNI